MSTTSTSSTIPTSTSSSTQSTSTTNCYHALKKKNLITVDFQNVNRSSVNSHIMLENSKHLDVVFLAEPYIRDSSTTQHPSFQLSNHITLNSKIAAYVNKRHYTFRHYCNRGGNVVSIHLGYTTLTGIYISSKSSIKEFRNDLSDIPTLQHHQRGITLVDFNSPDPDNQRGRALYDFAISHKLSAQIPTGAITFRRPSMRNNTTHLVEPHLD